MKHSLLSLKALGITIGFTILFVLIVVNNIQNTKGLLVQGVERSDIGANTRIIPVTTLSPYGPGSISEAVAQTGPRIIVFEVGGTIDFRNVVTYQNPFLFIDNNDVIIAGETAPEPGIHIIGAPIEILASNVVVRHVNVYTGTRYPFFLSSDAIKINAHKGENVRNILIENNAFFWAIDETGETWTDPVDFEIGRIKDVTFRNNIFGEALLAANQGTSNPQGALHPKGPHSNGFLISHGAQHIIFERNLFASNYRRNPWITGDTSTMLINNIIFNPDRHAFIFSGGNQYGDPPEEVISAESTIVGNVCYAGVDTSNWLLGNTDGVPKMFFGTVGTVGRNTHVYLNDNAFFDQDDQLIGKDAQVFNDPDGTITVEDQELGWRPLSTFSILPSDQVWNTVLSTVGPKPEATNRSHAGRLVAAVRSKQSRVINTEADVGGYPNFAVIRRAFAISSLSPIPGGFVGSNLVGPPTSQASVSSQTSSASTRPPVITFPSPVGQWLMNSTTLTPDTSGRGNNLTIVGSVPKVDDDTTYAASFNGVLSNHLTANPSTSLNMDGSSYTLSVWFKPTSITADYATMITKGAEGRFGKVPFQLFRDNDKVHMTIGDKTIQPILFLPDGSTDPRSGKEWADNLISPTRIEAGKWNHVVAWYDAIRDTINMSVNGETPVSINAEFTSGYENLVDTAPLFIGKMFNQKPFNGLISHVQMWKTLLSDAQRRSLYQDNIHCQTGAIDCTGASRIIDNDDEGYYQYGFTKNTTEGYRSTTRQRTLLASEQQRKGAIWLLKNADPGTYDVYTTWTAKPNNATAIPVTLSVPGNSNIAPVTSTINQSVAPRAESSLSGGTWQKIGSVTFANRSSIRVRMALPESASSKTIQADGVLFLRR